MPGRHVRSAVEACKRGQRVVVLGYVNYDFILAANYKLLLLAAMWTVEARGQVDNDKLISTATRCIKCVS